MNKEFYMKDFCLPFIIYCTLHDLVFCRNTDNLGEYYESPTKK